jgi:hypothetical protein
MGDEATGSRWSRNIDIAAKLLIPIALFGGSAILSASQQKEAKFQACAQRLFDFSKAACHESGECGARTQSEGVFLTGLVATVERLCTEANFEVPQEWWASAAPSIAQSNNVAATGEATKASGRVPQTSASSSIAGGELAKTTLEPSAATQTQLAAMPSGGPHPVGRSQNAGRAAQHSSVRGHNTHRARARTGRDADRGERTALLQNGELQGDGEPRCLSASGAWRAGQSCRP